ncbi:LytTR family DNA-binding domain-containing protein, partial [Chitinophaga sp.]|uniref:LytR/AlgR family response regulator transcription factor n=1 Tax=Chitinophaga sp. TaxID=1869181 RepID=UPI0031D2CC13
GLDFYKSIPQPSLVIFTTSYRDYAVESYEVNAVDYLLKPFTFARFQQAVEKAASRRQNTTQAPQLVLRVDYGLVKVFISDIQYIEGWDNYLKIYLKSQKPLLVRMTMKAIMEKLPPKDFIRVHRSYIVALSAIENVRNKQILIAGSDIPLGSSYEAAFFDVFKS